MSLATPSTQALAVRKHGGGLAPIQRPTHQAGGHPLRSKGGEINSLCCAAAGIINPLLRAAASHAYPTTCVRRAPFTAAPLRSQNRPHAQLVEGYKHSRKKLLLQHSSDVLSKALVMPQVFHVALFSVARNIPIAESINHTLSKISRDLQLTKHLNLCGVQLNNRDRTQRLNVGRPFQMQAIHEVTANGFIAIVTTRSAQCAIQHLELLVLIISQQVEQLTQPALLPPQLISRMHVGKRGSPHYGQHTPNRLNPSRLLFDFKVTEHGKESPTQSTNTEKGPSHPDGGNLHSLRNFEPLHLLQLLAAAMQPSLPTITPYVHGGAA